MIDNVVNLRNDIVFKLVFGSEKNERILISLLNAILGLETENKIVSLVFLNTLNIREILDDKQTSLDVKVTDNLGKRYNIEMQVASEKSYIQRAIYYHDKLYTGQLKSGEPYETLEKSISISMLNFNLLDNEKSYHNTYRYLNIESKKELTDVKEIHFIELLKFKKSDLDQVETKFDKWLYTIRYGENHILSIPDKLKSEEEIVMAIGEIHRVSEDDRVRELIESKEKAKHDEASRLFDAKKQGEQIGILKGRNEGEQIGILKGRNEGEQIGISKGTNQTKKELSIRLLKKRFKELTNEIVESINNTENMEKINQIIDNIFDLNSIEDVKKILLI